MNKRNPLSPQPPPSRDHETELRDLHAQVSSTPQPYPGMHALEIRIRLLRAGFPIPELALKMRRSPWFVTAVVERHKHSHAVRKTVAMLLAYQGLSFSQIWGEGNPPVPPSSPSTENTR